MSSPEIVRNQDGKAKMTDKEFKAWIVRKINELQDKFENQNTKKLPNESRK